MSEANTALVLRSANRINDETLDRLWKFYYETKTTIELKPKEEEIRKRLHNIWGYLGGDILTDRKAVLAHVKWCETEGIKMSERTGYEDLKYARMLWGDRSKQSKAAQRAVMNEILLNTIKECQDKKKHMSMARLIKEYVTMNNLNNHAPDDPTRRPAVTVTFQADPEVLKQQQKELRRRAEQANAQDVEFENA